MEQRLPNRRDLFRMTAAAPVAATLPQPAGSAPAGGKKFRISLAEWSLHRAIQSRLLNNMQFPRVAREHFGIEGLEFVNALWEAPTASYVTMLKRTMENTGTKAVLIMVDGEGDMGAPDKTVRLKAADNHRKWVEIAAELGCHSIRTNMYPGFQQPKTTDEINAFLQHCAESFGRLCEFARSHKINVLIENHGGVSSDPDVVVRLMKTLNLPNLGTLPDFGNFPKETDRYEAVRKMMPFAKGVSMKCYDFTPEGRETVIDMDKMMQIVLGAGYHDWIGIEYEGARLTEFEGIQAAKRCLERYL